MASPVEGLPKPPWGRTVLGPEAELSPTPTPARAHTVALLLQGPQALKSCHCQDGFTVTRLTRPAPCSILRKESFLHGTSGSLREALRRSRDRVRNPWKWQPSAKVLKDSKP